VAHFVYTSPGPAGPYILGTSIDIDEESANRIVVDLEHKVGEKVTAHQVPAYTPQPIQVGNIVSGKTADTLPKGTGIVRVSTADGAQVRPSGCLVRTPSGWVSGATDEPVPGPIDGGSRYRVLHIGQPWDGPPSTAHHR
jgi:hypothetical protein